MELAKLYVLVDGYKPKHNSINRMYEVGQDNVAVCGLQLRNQKFLRYHLETCEIYTSLGSFSEFVDDFHRNHPDALAFSSLNSLDSISSCCLVSTSMKLGPMSLYYSFTRSQSYRL